MTTKIHLAAWAAACAFLATFSIAPDAFADDAPTVAKDSVLVQASTNPSFHKSFDTWSWVPQISFRVNGPIESGGQLWVSFTVPGIGEVKFDCPTQETQPGHHWKTTCGGHDVPEDKGTTAIGIVPFAIHMRNELAGSDVTLFTGRAKVDKVHSNEHGPKAVNKFTYYVNQDWNLPISYVYLTADDTRAWKLPRLNVAFWVRGETPNFDPHLFFQGKEIGKKYFQGEEVAKASCDPEVQALTTRDVDPSLAPQKAEWTRMYCSFPSVMGWDKTGEGPGMLGPNFLLSDNPGDYEFKLLWSGHLARTIKFTVGPDGHFDNGIAKANKLGNERVIFPIQILGDQDGTWDRTAWHNAFYGNPLTGFTPLP